MHLLTGTSSQFRRAVLAGIAVAALAHLAPLHLVQKLDGAMLGTFAELLPLQNDDEIVFVDMAEPGAMAALSSGAMVTIVGPSALAIGPIAGSGWAEGLAWVFAIVCLVGLLLAKTRRRRRAWLSGAVAPAALVGASAMAFAVSGMWIPVAGPVLLLLATGTMALATGNQTLKALPIDAPPEPGVAKRCLERGELLEAWDCYRELPPTRDLLGELFELGVALEREGYSELAADTFTRIALVNPEYPNVARALVNAARPDAFEDEAERERLRAEMPSELGRYRLLEPIGRGTTGRVYLALDPHIHRLVAIKLIDLALERDADEVADAKERFRREAETTGRLSHPNIVTIYDMDEAAGRAYIAMEYLKGDLLSRFTAKETLLPASLILELGAKTADALDYAHNQNVIHRDIKPANIMYDSISGDLKITDFGIARLVDVQRTRTGVVLGTPSFMAPEQIEGGNVKGYTDLFALGVTLYELLTGQLPFRGNSMTKLMFVIANEPHLPVSAQRPDLPLELDSVIDTALQKEPEKRFQRGAEMANALRAMKRLLA